MSASTDLLRRVAEGRTTDEDRAVLAGAVTAYLDGAAAGVTLDQAFGVARSPGGMSWWRVEALGRRDAAIRALAGRFYAGRTIARQASAIHTDLRRYAASAWRFDHRERSVPARYLGTPREMMFDALRACESVPGARHIRRILRP